jgi:hypothetical protein
MSISRALRLTRSCFAGFFFSRLIGYAHQKGFLDRESYIAQYIALALFTAGAANSLGNDDLLAAFAAGVFALPHTVFLCSILRQVVQSLGMVVSRKRPKAIHSPRCSSLSSTAPASSISERGSRLIDFISLSLV